MIRVVRHAAQVSPPSEMDDDDDDDPMGDDDMQVMTMDDGLKDEMRKRNTIITRLIVKAAQLISEKVGGLQHGKSHSEAMRAVYLECT